MQGAMGGMQGGMQGGMGNNMGGMGNSVGGGMDPFAGVGGFGGMPQQQNPMGMNNNAPQMQKYGS